MVTKGLLHNNKRIFISRTGMRILLNGGGDGNSAEGVVHKRNGEHGRLLRVQSKGSRSNGKATCAGVSYGGYKRKSRTERSLDAHRYLLVAHGEVGSIGTGQSVSKVDLSSNSTKIIALIKHSDK